MQVSMRHVIDRYLFLGKIRTLQANPANASNLFHSLGNLSGDDDREYEFWILNCSFDLSVSIQVFLYYTINSI